jgi:hypothetical protein
LKWHPSFTNSSFSFLFFFVFIHTSIQEIQLKKKCYLLNTHLSYKDQFAMALTLPPSLWLHLFFLSTSCCFMGGRSGPLWQERCLALCHHFVVNKKCSPWGSWSPLKNPVEVSRSSWTFCDWICMNWVTYLRVDLKRKSWGRQEHNDWRLTGALGSVGTGLSVLALPHGTRPRHSRWHRHSLNW